MSLNLDEFPCEFEPVPNDPSGAVSCRMHLPDISDKDLPTVSILTPTYNRSEFVTLMNRNWDSINYPRDKLEWVIVDDSPIPTPGLSSNNSKNIRYIHIKKKMTLGNKRNFLACLAHNEILVHFDDDDFYPAESVLARVKTILASDGKNCVGCSKTLCYDLLHDQTFEAFDRTSDGGYATISESSMAYRKSFWLKQNFNNDDKEAECIKFIYGRHSEVLTIPYIFVVTQFSHHENTVKRWLQKGTQLKSHSVPFPDTINMFDSVLINELRAKVVSKLPEWQDAIHFVKKNASKTKKKLDKELNKSPENLLYNPLIINLIRQHVTKTNSSGKDIVYYCGPGKKLRFSVKWNGKSKSIGGSEEAVINLSEQWVSMGYNVTVYCVHDRCDVVHNGVTYKPYWKWVPGDKQDVTIIWRDPTIIDDIDVNSERLLLDLHDVIDVNWLEKYPKHGEILCKSNFHKKIINNSNNNNGEKITVIPNGINKQLYSNLNINQKDKYKIICTSSPDRCITALLHATPLIRKEIPNAEIYWAYGFKSGITEGGMEKIPDPQIQTWLANVKNLIKNTEGFHDIGRLSQEEVSKLYASANILAYGTNFPEIDCISMTKAMASGCIPIVTSCGALKDKLKFVKFCTPSVHQTTTLGSVLDYSCEGEIFNEWVGNIIKQLKLSIEDTIEDRKNMRKVVIENYSWKRVSKQWINLFSS